MRKLFHNPFPEHVRQLGCDSMKIGKISPHSGLYHFGAIGGVLLGVCSKFIAASDFSPAS